MKRKSLVKVMAILLMVVLAMPILAATTNIRVVVNGEKIVFPDAKPYMDSNSRILIPVRFVSEKLGAEVDWDIANQTVTIADSTHTATLVIGKKQMTINGETKTLDTAASVENSRTYVPIRFVSEALGATVEWDSKGKSVYINTNGQPIVKDQVIEYKGFSYALEEGDKYNPAGQYGDEYVRTKDMMRIIFIRDEDNALILTLQASYEMVGGDFYKQCKELEEVLSQQVSKTCVDQIMTYVYKKTTHEAWLDKKEFNDSNYRITVISKPNSLVELDIYEK